MKNYKRKFRKILTNLKKLSLDYYKHNLVALVVFGSVAKDRFSPASDIDLLIILENREGNYEEFIKYFDNIESKLAKEGFLPEINPIFKGKDELKPELIYLWDTDFLILYEKEGFFSKFLENLQKFKKERLSYGKNFIEILQKT
jgi:predicted nucleotidyltransferase